MSRKTIVIIVLVLALAGIGAYAMSRQAVPVAPSEEATTTNASATPATTSVATSTHQYVWTFADAGTDKDNGAPITAVTLGVDGTTHALGNAEGSCSVKENDLLPNEKSSVLCWFAGGGTEYGAFEENGKVMIKKGTVDEGSAETEGFRGDFKTILAL